MFHLQRLWFVDSSAIGNGNGCLFRAAMNEPSANPPDEPRPKSDGPPLMMPRSAAAESSHAPSHELDKHEHCIESDGDSAETALKAASGRPPSNEVSAESSRKSRCGALEEWCNEHLLNPIEQRAAAVLTALALTGVVAWWIWQGGATGRTIDVDHAPAVPLSFVVNVNEADWPELSVLPGIGPVLAQRIVASREQDGPFRSVDDLRRVRGIGPITLERLRPHIAVLSSSDSAVAEVNH